MPGATSGAYDKQSALPIAHFCQVANSVFQCVCVNRFNYLGATHQEVSRKTHVRPPANTATIPLQILEKTIAKAAARFKLLRFCFFATDNVYLLLRCGRHPTRRCLSGQTESYCLQTDGDGQAITGLPSVAHEKVESANLKHNLERQSITVGSPYLQPSYTRI